jgi:hypothetical protein
MMAPASTTQARTLCVSIVLLAMLLAVGFPVSVSAGGSSRIVIHAVVLAVDPAQGLVALHHEALETGTATDRICRLRHRRDVLMLRRGTVIEAYAETSHQPWILDDVHVRARTTFAKPALAI